jgi:hypothetical protein
MSMTEEAMQRRVTALTLLLGKVLEDAPEDVIAKAMDVFPDILLAEIRRVEGYSESRGLKPG